MYLNNIPDVYFGCRLSHDVWYTIFHLKYHIGSQKGLDFRTLLISNFQTREIKLAWVQEHNTFSQRKCIVPASACFYEDSGSSSSSSLPLPAFIEAGGNAPFH